jgi:hypothetical protein
MIERLNSGRSASFSSSPFPIIRLTFASIHPLHRIRWLTGRTHFVLFARRIIRVIAFARSFDRWTEGSMPVPALISAASRQEHLGQLRKLAHAVNAAKGRSIISAGPLPSPFLVLADLNCPLWSPLFKPLLCQTDLQHTRNGFGIKPTWSSVRPRFSSYRDMARLEARISPLFHPSRGASHDTAERLPDDWFTRGILEGE